MSRRESKLSRREWILTWRDLKMSKMEWKLSRRELKMRSLVTSRISSLYSAMK